MDGPPNDLDPADLFRPHTGAMIDDSRTWVDPSGYRLSDRLWRGRAADRKQIDKVLREGIARGSSPLQTARALEGLLVPSQGIRRDDKGRAIPLEQQPKGVATRTPRQGPGVGAFRPRNSGTGSYAARRLARTETSRAFGNATLEAAKANPLVRRIKWRMSSSHGETDACDTAADNSSPGEPRGVYLIEDVPGYPNHPHEMCTLNPYVTNDDIKDAIPRIRRAIREDDFSPESMRLPLIGPPSLFAPLIAPLPVPSLDDLLGASDDLDDLLSADIPPGGLPRVDPLNALTDHAAMKSAMRSDHPYRRDELPAEYHGDYPGWAKRNKNYELAPQGFTQDQADALSEYKGSEYRRINQHLRTGDPVTRWDGADATPEVRKRIEDLDAAFDQVQPLQDTLKLRRNSETDFIGLDTAKPGDTFTDKGYGSTTVRTDWDSFGGNNPGGMRMVIYTPPGSKAMPMDEALDSGVIGYGEAEVLLPRNTTYMIRSADPLTRLVEVEVVP